LTGSWVTDTRHFLNEQGRIPDDLPAVPRYLGTIVAAASALPAGRVNPLELRCRRRPGHRSCPGSIHASVDLASAEILWFCPWCDDHGVIYNWHDSPWDRRPTPSETTAPSTGGLPGFSPQATAAWNAVPPQLRMRLLNNFWCGVCRTTASVDLRSGTASGADLILRGYCTRGGSEIARVVEEVAGRP
jgi:hypothetical protein